MTLDEVLKIMYNRVSALRNARITAVNNGDLENVLKIDNDLVTTMMSIEELETLIAESTND